MPWFDTHCHLDFDAFSTDFPQFLTQFKNAGITRLLVPSVSRSNWQNVLKLNTKQEISIALGCHPCFLPSSEKELTTELFDLQTICLEHQQQIVAIGESGFDGRFPESEAQQLLAFESQILLAKQLKLPLIVHSVRKHALTYERLKQHNFDQGGVIHAFSGSYQQAKQFVDLGFKIGIGGTITWPRAQKTIKAVSKLPIDSLVLETDAPDMPLFGMQGIDNSPLNLPKIFHALHAIRSEPQDQLKQHLWQNSLDVFRLNE
ncbi:TatD family deoxyribonuclease [Alginatibacterium sediminis]|uniref:TatD family deoxyribonuclease n=1 Tax=Alginatibacterium sediminis TaxID=2164068 RepID=A0A420E8S3_9ALTE|nr:TatD family hydrolase [Alginatibacterium sediminis]RKF15738.1 TatD family deoxyribonuclease [Alginatibacterium sediminis]